MKGKAAHKKGTLCKRRSSNLEADPKNGAAGEVIRCLRVCSRDKSRLAPSSTRQSASSTISTRPTFDKHQNSAPPMVALRPEIFSFFFFVSAHGTEPH